MGSIDYREKYLKYKNKYLNLKKQFGGIDDNCCGFEQCKCENFLPCIKFLNNKEESINESENKNCNYVGTTAGIDYTKPKYRIQVCKNCGHLNSYHSPLCNGGIKTVGFWKDELNKK